jgi:hypothetical protein
MLPNLRSEAGKTDSSMGFENQSRSEARFGSGSDHSFCLALQYGLGHFFQSTTNID